MLKKIQSQNIFNEDKTQDSNMSKSTIKCFHDPSIEIAKAAAFFQDKYPTPEEKIIIISLKYNLPSQEAFSKIHDLGQQLLNKKYDTGSEQFEIEITNNFAIFISNNFTLLSEPGIEEYYNCNIIFFAQFKAECDKIALSSIEYHILDAFYIICIQNIDLSNILHVDIKNLLEELRLKKEALFQENFRDSNTNHYLDLLISLTEKKEKRECPAQDAFYFYKMQLIQSIVRHRTTLLEFIKESGLLVIVRAIADHMYLHTTSCILYWNHKDYPTMIEPDNLESANNDLKKTILLTYSIIYAGNCNIQANDKNPIYINLIMERKQKMAFYLICALIEFNKIYTQLLFIVKFLGEDCNAVKKYGKDIYITLKYGQVVMEMLDGYFKKYLYNEFSIIKLCETNRMRQAYIDLLKKRVDILKSLQSKINDVELLLMKK